MAYYSEIEETVKRMIEESNKRTQKEIAEENKRQIAFATNLKNKMEEKLEKVNEDRESKNIKFERINNIIEVLENKCEKIFSQRDMAKKRGDILNEEIAKNSLMNDEFIMKFERVKELHSQLKSNDFKGNKEKCKLNSLIII